MGLCVKGDFAGTTLDTPTRARFDQPPKTRKAKAPLASKKAPRTSTCVVIPRSENGNLGGL